MPISMLPQDQDGQELYNAISSFFPIFIRKPCGKFENISILLILPIVLIFLFMAVG